uniref:Uncharacterized protein n=1 Tax=Heterorhabditis bacteriophora TaxID=37862 RepID=A0A1I7WWN8_HETBA
MRISQKFGFSFISFLQMNTKLTQPSSKICLRI